MFDGVNNSYFIVLYDSDIVMFLLKIEIIFLYFYMMDYIEILVKIFYIFMVIYIGLLD